MIKENKMLHDKDSTSILLIEPASSVRQMISDVLKDLGFSQVLSVSKGKDAIHVLEVEKIDWIITSTLANDDITFIHLLDIIIKEPLLRHIRTSVLIEADNEEYTLPLAFELGLFTWHKKAYLKDSIISEFEDLFSLYNIKKKNDILTSAEYLRKFLDENRGARNRLVFEQNLLSLFPGSSQCLLSLAEAQHLNGRNKDALMTLQQVEIISPKLKPLCDRLRKSKIAVEETVEIDPSKSPNCLNLKECIVIDSDTDNLHYISCLLSDLGVKKINCFEDGDAAFLSLKNGAEPSAIFMEWRVPGVTGPMLIQRIRNHGFVTTPIFVVSSLVEKQDIHLMKEMGVDEVIPKPFEAESFYSSLIWCIQQNRKPSEQKSYELKIHRLLDHGKFTEAERIALEFFKDNRIEKADKLAIQAELKFIHEDYPKVVNACLAVLKKNPGDVRLLNLLGKTFLKLEKFEKALLCFEKAQDLSPSNIKRLIDIADVNIALDRKEDCDEALSKAKSIDSEADIVVQADCRIALEKGDLESSKKLLKEIDCLSSIVRDMNNRAVALARNGRYEDGIALYRNTLDSLDTSEKELINIVSYNLSLAYARYGDLQKAEQLLGSIDRSFQYSVDKKVASLLEKIKVCLAENKSITFNSGQESSDEQETIAEGQDDDEASPIIEEDIELLNSTLQAQQGDICCHLLFFDLEGLCMQAEKLRDNPPHFSRRRVIDKAS